MELKFQVEIRGNNKSRAFHTNVVVGRSVIDHYASWLTGSYEDVLHDQGQIVAKMVRDLLRLGAYDIFVKPYEVSVYIDDSKRPWRRWDERIDEVVENTFKELGMEQGIPSGKKVVIGKSQSGRLEYHTNFEVSRSVIENFKRPLRDSSESYLTKIGSEGASLVRNIMALPGITEIWTHPYEISVGIGQAFSWTERDDNGKTLEDKIKLAFKEVFGDITFITK